MNEIEQVKEARTWTLSRIAIQTCFRWFVLTWKKLVCEEGEAVVDFCMRSWGREESSLLTSERLKNSKMDPSSLLKCSGEIMLQLLWCNTLFWRKVKSLSLVDQFRKSLWPWRTETLNLVAYVLRLQAVCTHKELWREQCNEGTKAKRVWGRSPSGIIFEELPLLWRTTPLPIPCWPVPK